MRRQKELKPALYKLFKYKPPVVKTTQLGATCTSDPECQTPFKENLICGGDEEVSQKICVIPPKQLFTTGQIIGSTSAGVVGLGVVYFAGAGVFVGGAGICGGGAGGDAGKVDGAEDRQFPAWRASAGVPSLA